MAKYLILFPLLFSHPLQSFEVIKDANRLTLKSPSCQEISRITFSLKEWLETIGENKKCSATLPSKIKADVDLLEDGVKRFCSVDITDCVPEHVLKYQGSKPKVEGPNCWNLALVMKNILPALRYSSPEEMAFYTRPPLCRQLSQSEPRKAGDIGSIKSIYNNEVGETHGFIYISEDAVYSKNGSDENSRPYELQSFKEMLNLYQVPKNKECRENQIDLGCKSALSFFRCISMEQYLKENPPASQELMTSLNNLSQFENCFQEKIFKNLPIDNSSKSLLLNTTKALMVYLKSESEKESSEHLQTPEKTFILGSLQLRLLAIADQLDQMNDTDFIFDLEEQNTELSDLIKSSVDELKQQKK